MRERGPERGRFVHIPEHRCSVKDKQSVSGQPCQTTAKQGVGDNKTYQRTLAASLGRELLLGLLI